LGERPGKLELHEMLPGSAVDVALYWHHWEREPLSAQRLTKAIKQAAHKVLL
jgi:LysR family transcriptional regulator (chromosome initiation inhibitor)